MRRQNKYGLWITEAFMLLFILIFIYPLFLVGINSLKNAREVVSNVIALPTEWVFKNYAYVWQYVNYPKLFLNNFTITGVGVTGIIAFSSIAAFILSRTQTKVSWIIYLFCISPMLIPFQAIMIPLLKLAKICHVSGSVLGLGIQYWGFGVPTAIFLYHGFVKTIPRELDESAIIDGASTLRMFYSIIFPLLKPITSTIIVIDVMWIWNDFLLPLIMVSGSKETSTLTLAAYSFIGQYVTDWQYALTAIVLAIFPSILFFIFMQRFIVKGVVSGAIKG